MKVILLANVDKLGKKNDIVEVNDGYAKNFLIKKGLAIQDTKNSLQKLNEQLDQEKQIYEASVYEANLLKQKLEELDLVFYLHSDHHGNSFGKVSNKELIDQINKNEKLINKYMLLEKCELGLGQHFVKIKLHDNVIANVKVNVVEINK